MNPEPRTLSDQAARLPVGTVLRIERLVGGDPVTEGLVLDYIEERFGARNLLYLPQKVAAAILDRPDAFLRTAKNFFEPELPF